MISVKMKTSPIVIAVLVFILFVLIIVVSNIVYAQKILPNTQQKLTSPPLIPPKLHGVKITSPFKGQQISLGKNFTISGTSIDNPNSNCQISIAVNRVKPYQLANATGSGGSNDYSKWNFVLSSKYTTIKQGPDNKITAKYICSDNPNVASFYSINITGVTPVVASNAHASQPPLQQTKNTITNTNNNNNINNATNTKGQETSLSNSNNASTVNGTNIAALTPFSTLGSDKLTYLGNTKSLSKSDNANPTVHSKVGDNIKSHGISSTSKESTKHHNNSSKSKTHHGNHKSKSEAGSKTKFDPFNFPIYG
jgi:hypothetical protein